MKKILLVLLGLAVLAFAVFYFFPENEETANLSNTVSSTSTTPANQANSPSIPSTKKTTPSPVSTPTFGPYVHQLLSASSQDGLAWTTDEAIVLDHASVPDVFTRTDGALGLVYVDPLKRSSGDTGGLGCAISEDNSQTWSTQSCRVSGWESLRAADPSMVVLSDGRYRLYAYVSDGSEDINSKTDHTIRSAISEDGLNFTDEGVVFTYTGLVDPDVFWNGSEWVMFVHSVTTETTLIAVSSDGLSFQYEKDMGVGSFILMQPVLLPDSTFRTFGFDRMKMQTFVGFISTDGLNWTQADDSGIVAAEDKRITDPQIVQLSDGSWKMVFKTEDIIKKN